MTGQLSSFHNDSSKNLDRLQMFGFFVFSRALDQKGDVTSRVTKYCFAYSEFMLCFSLHTHTPMSIEHKHSGQPFLLGCPVSDYGHKGTSVAGNEGGREHCSFTLHLHFLPVLRLQPTTFGFQVRLSNNLLQLPVRMTMELPHY